MFIAALINSDGASLKPFRGKVVALVIPVDAKRVRPWEHAKRWLKLIRHRAGPAASFALDLGYEQGVLKSLSNCLTCEALGRLSVDDHVTSQAVAAGVADIAHNYGLHGNVRGRIVPLVQQELWEVDSLSFLGQRKPVSSQARSLEVPSNGAMEKGGS
ncbi:hypothetical protein [Pseudarthrobacter quantipunctorum]|uniref:Uncharacterized protein n=1 Tax=Pseudarthrobacter quantipunctorum TaxID=3128980 RepID=A0ABZ2R7Q4_9MICC